MNNPPRLKAHMDEVFAEFERQGIDWLHEDITERATYLGITADGFHTSHVGNVLVQTCVIEPEKYDEAVKELFDRIPLKKV